MIRDKQKVNISVLEKRNEEIQHTLTQKKQKYEDMEQKKLVIENKIAHIEHEMKRIQAL